VRRLRAGDDLLAAVKGDGTVLVEGEYVGRLDGFRFRVDDAVEGEDAKALLSAARRVLLREIPARLRRLESEPDEAFALQAEGLVSWRGVAVARFAPGEAILRPGVEPLASEFLDGRARERLRRRLAAWLARYLEAELAPLFRIARIAARDQDVPGPARGLLYQLSEALGLLPRAGVAAQVRGIGRSGRKRLAALGVRLGRESIYLPALIGAGNAGLRGLLWAVHYRRAASPPPAPRARSFVPPQDADDGYCRALGYLRLGGRHEDAVAVRADVLERLAREAWQLAAQGPFAPTPRLARLAECDAATLEVVLRALRYRVRRDEAGTSFVPIRARAGGTAHGGRRARPHAAESPFAKLRQLTAGR